MTDPTGVLRALLLDSSDRIAGLVASTTDGLTREVAIYRQDPDANTIAWLVRHLTRVQDSHRAELAGAPRGGPTRASSTGPRCRSAMAPPVPASPGGGRRSP